MMRTQMGLRECSPRSLLLIRWNRTRFGTIAIQDVRGGDSRQATDILGAYYIR